MEIKNRQKVLLVVAVAGLSLLLGDWLVVEPLLRSWKGRSNRIAELKQQVAQGTVLVDREQAIRGHWEDMRTNTLPATTSLAEAEFIKTFYRCVRDSGISVVSFRPQWKQNGDEYMTYDCSADAAGNIEAVSRFLYEVEKDPLALRLDNLKITSRDDNGRQIALTIQISGLMLTASTQP